jgi:choline dehydrogenase-like flavoprotein
MVALHEAAARPRNVFTRHDLHHDTVIDCDVVVVGSGAGGAPIAAELAEAGFDVVVLEEGAYYQTRDFTADTSQMVRQLYRDGGATIAIGNPPIMFQEGRAVGGSTVINGGMSWRTPDDILARWREETGIADLDGNQLEPYYERVERRIHVAPMDDDAIGNDNWLLKKGADAKGWKIVGNLRNQAHCVGSNRCAFGCPTGAKQSALVSYIPRALHFGARVYADVRVSRVTFHGKRATGVVGRSAAGHHVVVRSKLVVAACGAIHTPALLSRSGIASRSGMLGRNLSLHPNVKVVAIFDEAVTGWKGAHQAFQVREFADQGLGCFAAVNLPPSIVAMSLPHRGAQLGELMADYDKMVVAGLLCEDTTTGHVKTIAGRPQAFYQLSPHDAANMQRGLELLSELLFAAGAKRVLLPFHHAKELASADEARRVLGSPIRPHDWEVVTVHMMGTARMGTDRLGAVTDAFGFVHDADRLMVSDASLFPSPCRVNPMETIMALATRAAGHVIDNARRYLS